jgi:hypothetical protein
VAAVTEEIWKPVVGYEGLYEVSNMGRVRKLVRVPMKPKAEKYGYQRIGLYKDGKHKQFLVHRLVAEAFIDNPNDLPIINHKDECPSNNAVENLEWCTYKYNANYGTALKRKSENIPNKKKIMSIDKKTGEKKTYNSIADAYYDVTKRKKYTGSISEAASGKRKSAYGKYWVYVDLEEEK